MRNKQRNVIWGWLMIGGLAAGQVSARIPGDIPARCSYAWAEATASNAADDEMDRFFKAKELVFKRGWRDACKGLESYLKDYPKGRLRDEALYWLAQSLNMLSKSAEGQEAILDLKRDAIRRLDSLAESFPESLWQDDGLALQVEIAGQLVLAGREEYKSYIDEAVATRKQDQRELKILALNSLMDMDPDYALPIFRRILKEDPDPDIRKRALALVAQGFSSEARSIIVDSARKDEDRGVRQEAEKWIEKITARDIPVQLGYRIYGCRILDEGKMARFPEGRVKTFSLPLDDWNNQNRVLDQVREALEIRISRPLSSADGSLPAPGLFSEELRVTTTHRAADYQLWIKPGKLRITEDRIQGEVQFRHRETNRKFDADFKLEEGERKLLVSRSGDKLSLLILQFMETAVETESPRSVTVQSHELQFSEIWRNLSREFGMEKRPVLHTEFSNLMGWEIHSSRGSWTLDEMRGKTGKYDFGYAEAVSLSSKSWKLIGHLLLIKKSGAFIARKAVLIDPEGKTAAVGDEITIPVADPARFKVAGLREMEESGVDLPDHGSFDINGVFNLSSDLKVHTVRKYFDAAEFERNLVNFQQSRAVFSKNGKEWTLLGDIFWLKKQSRLIGFGSILVDEDRRVRARGLISVPLENPSAFEALRGRPVEGRQLLLGQDERRTRGIYSTLYSNVQGWAVHTTLNSGHAGSENRQDYSLALATRSVGGTDWILIGRILLLKQERRFIARDAALLNSDGENVFGAELQVSTDDPADYRIVKR